MTRNGEPIHKIQLKYKLDTGIEIKGFPGVVPEYYAVEAAKAAHYLYFEDEWQKLERWQKAQIIAHYFIGSTIESHKNEVVQDKIHKDARKRGNK